MSEKRKSTNLVDFLITNNNKKMKDNNNSNNNSKISKKNLNNENNSCGITTIDIDDVMVDDISDAEEEDDNKKAKPMSSQTSVVVEYQKLGEMGIAKSTINARNSAIKCFTSFLKTKQLMDVEIESEENLCQISLFQEFAFFLCDVVKKSSDNDWLSKLEL